MVSLEEVADGAVDLPAAPPQGKGEGRLRCHRKWPPARCSLLPSAPFRRATTPSPPCCYITCHPHRAWRGVVVPLRSGAGAAVISFS